MGGQWKLNLKTILDIFLIYFPKKQGMGNAHWDWKKQIQKASRIVRIKWRRIIENIKIQL